jgi:hypothetical protein
MIITRRRNSLFLVTQNDHGRLAGELCECWGNEQFASPSPAESMRLAAAMHDEGWRGADDEPRFNAQAARPLHFLEIGQDEHIAFYRRGVEAAVDLEPYAGLLVSMHWTGLYRSRWGLQGDYVFIRNDTSLAQLQSEVIAAEERRWIDLKRPLVEGVRRSDFETGLWHNYELLQTFDVMSLYVCSCVLEPAANGDAPVAVISTLKTIDRQPGPRAIESVPRRAAGERTDVVLTAIEPGVVAVDPYPFNTDRFRVGVRALAIPDRRYLSPQDVAAAVATAAEVRIECEFMRRS